MSLSSHSNFWTTSRKANQPRQKIPLIIEAFSYSDLEWLGASRVIFEVDFALDNDFTLSYPIRKPKGCDFVLCIRLDDGSRYKLWNHDDDDLHYPLYSGQLISADCSVEIWSTTASTVTSAGLEILSNNTELDVCCHEANTDYDGTIDTTIFATLDEASGDADETLIFDEELPTAASAVPSAPVLSGAISPPFDISLTWTDVSGETGYKLYRSSDNITFVLVATLANDVLAYLDTFGSGSGFYYKVKAYNSVGDSVFSNTVNIVTSFTMYYGRNAGTTVNEAAVLAMTALTQSGPGGIYTFGAAAGYIYFAWPAAETAPTSIKVGAFDFVLADSGLGYASTTNGLTHTTLTVSGASHRIYRSYNTLAGAINVTVT